jgi:folate-binding Fe-S cluster repair protein YgfZ
MPLPPALRSLLRHTPSLAPVPHRAVLSVTGSQASEFLQGVVSASVTSPPKPGYSALLHAQVRVLGDQSVHEILTTIWQGRVLHDVLLYTQKDAKGQPGYLIEYDPRPSEAPPLLELLKRYVLRAKVRIRDASEEYSVWSAWGSDTQNTRDAPREWSWAKSGVVEPAWGRNVDWPWGKDDHSMVDQRAFGMGARLLSSKGDKRKSWSCNLLAETESLQLEDLTTTTLSPRMTTHFIESSMGCQRVPTT